jgi:hypothetical protein
MFSNTRIKKMMNELRVLKENNPDNTILLLQNRIKTLEDTNKTLTATQKELQGKITILESKLITPIK